MLHNQNTNLSKISDSLVKLFSKSEYQIDEDRLRNFFNTSFDGNESTYDQLKIANGKLHKRIANETHCDIKRTVLLNMLSIAYGYKNHHHMKHSFEAIVSASLKQTSFDGADSPLGIFFVNKKEISEILAGKGIMFSTFVFTAGKRELRLELKSTVHELSVQEKAYRESAQLLKSLGIKMHKASLIFPIASKEDDPSIASAIVKKYGAFFYPNWRKSTTGLEAILPGEISAASFHDVKISAPDMFTVGNLSCDMPWKTVVAALNTMLLMDNGRREFDIEIIQALLGIKKIGSLSGSQRMSELIDIVKREEILLKRKMGRGSFDEVVRKHLKTNFIYRVKKPEMVYIEHIQRHTGKALGKVIRSILEEAIEINRDKMVAGVKLRFDLENSMIKRAEQLCGISYDKLADNDDDLWHHDMRKTIKHLLQEVIEHLELIQGMLD